LLQIHARAPTTSPALESRGDARDDAVDASRAPPRLEPLSGGDAWPHAWRGLGCDARGDNFRSHAGTSAAPPS
jgi:hypothetical protein